VDPQFAGNTGLPGQMGWAFCVDGLKVSKVVDTSSQQWLSIPNQRRRLGRTGFNTLNTVLYRTQYSHTPYRIKVGQFLNWCNGLWMLKSPFFLTSFISAVAHPLAGLFRIASTARPLQ
jgi:hypothetical protein